MRISFFLFFSFFGALWLSSNETVARVFFLRIHTDRDLGRKARLVCRGAIQWVAELRNRIRITQKKKKKKIEGRFSKEVRCSKSISKTHSSVIFFFFFFASSGAVFWECESSRNPEWNNWSISALYLNRIHEMALLLLIMYLSLPSVFLADNELFMSPWYIIFRKAVI